MNLLWKIVTGIFLDGIIGILVWALIYLCVPNVKNWTDEKVFGIGVVEDDTTTEDTEVEVPETSAVIDFVQNKIFIGG